MLQSIFFIHKLLIFSYFYIGDDFLNITIPFSKEIIFKSKIAEITSISLEHDISINDEELLGDFIISGEYKNLDVNVDTFPFSHVVPFNVSLDSDVDVNSLKYEIVDFNYEIINEEILKVNINLHVEADKIFKKVEEIFEKPDEETLRSDVDTIAINSEVNDDEVSKENVNNVDIRDNNVTIDTVLNYDNVSDDFVTYHVHIVKIDETIQSICEEYNVTKEELLELNDVTDISMGDKLIIRDNEK